MSQSDRLCLSSGSVLALTDDSCGLVHQLVRHYAQASHWIIAGGSPCQGLSSANQEGRGFGDHRSVLIWTLPVVISTVARLISLHESSAQVHFIVENVIPRTLRQRQAIDALFQTSANRIDNGTFSGISRPRLWWLSFPLLPPVAPDRFDPATFLSPGWRPLWELVDNFSWARRFGTRLRPCDPGEPLEFPVPWRRFPLSMYGLNHLAYRPSATATDLEDLRFRVKEGITSAPSDDLRPPRCIPDAIIRRGLFARWLHLEGGSSICRCLSINEVEVGMGYPIGHTSLPPSPPTSDEDETEWLRHSLIGNSFAVQTMSFVLSGLSAIFQDTGHPPPRRDLTSLAASREAAIRTLSSTSTASWSLPSNAAH